MTSIKVFLYTLVTMLVPVWLIVTETVDNELPGVVIFLQLLILVGVILYWFTLFIGFLLSKIIPEDVQNRIGHALIEYSNSQEDESIFPSTSRRTRKTKTSQSRYKAQYRQSTTWWDVCPPTFENAAISYAEKYKGNNPNAKVRVVEVIDSKVVGTIYSC